MPKTNFIFIDNLPPYGSLIVDKNSGGLGGEIFLPENKRGFFNITGDIIHEHGKNSTSEKQIYELKQDNEYTFDFDNLLRYLYDIEDEFKLHDLCNYKSFSRDSDAAKRINVEGWNNRKESILSKKDNLSISIYLKKSTQSRCFLGSSDSDGLYYQIIAYTVIPNHTSMTIEKEEKSSGGAKYIFRLFFNPNNNSIDEDDQKSKKAESTLRKDKTTEELIEAARKRELSKEQHKQAQQTASDPYAASRKQKRVYIDYERDETISAAVKSRADGKCDLCGNDAPFNDSYDQPFLEEHHVEWLKNGGTDTLDNAVALCPNCHRKMHIVNDINDVAKLRERLDSYAQQYAHLIEQTNS